jgi:acetyl-CoA acetyltransferase
MISDPLQLLDFCLETDGACALVVTSAERARDLKQKPVFISAVGYGPGRTIHSQPWGALTETGARVMAPRLYGMAGVTPADLDFACFYDAFTYMVLLQLEDYGFCAKGEGGPFAAGGALALGGSLPANPHGGHLSEGYIHGYNQVTEAVEQLRDQSGARQVASARVALVTGAPGGPGLDLFLTNALILRN